MSERPIASASPAPCPCCGRSAHGRTPPEATASTTTPDASHPRPSPRLRWRDRLRRLPAAVSVNALAAAAFLALANLGAMPLATGVAQADVGSAMDDAFNSMGAAANVTGPTAFQGQSAGYYSLGNIYARFPQKQVNPVSINLPNARGGCGGIDLFAGSFSFINAGELVALMKAVANNSVGFAFKLAIDTVCPECAKVMEEMRQAAQLMNNQGINSCQAAAAIVGSVWPKSDVADREICQQFGNSTGKFTDYAASMAGCGPGGRRESTLGQAATDPNYKDVTSKPRNFTWEVIKKSAYFSPGGEPDRELAGYVMTLVGTIIYVPGGDGSPGKYDVRAPQVSSELVSALLDGNTSAPVNIMYCDAGDDACLNPSTRTLSIPAAKALRPRVLQLITDMVGNIKSNTPITSDQKALLQVASVPLMKVLTVQAAYGGGLDLGEAQTLAEVTAADLLFNVLDQMMNEVSQSRGAFDANEESAKLTQWSNGIRDARAAVQQRQQTVQLKVSMLMQIIQKTQFLESTLTSSMTPQMAASLDWSRGVQGRGIGGS